MGCSLQVSEERVRNGAGALEGAVSLPRPPASVPWALRTAGRASCALRGHLCSGDVSSSPRLRPPDARSTPTTHPKRQTEPSPAVGRCPLGAQSPQLGTSDPPLTTLGPFPFPYSAPERERETDPVKDQLLPRTYTAFPWGQCDPCFRNNLKKPLLSHVFRWPLGTIILQCISRACLVLTAKTPRRQNISHRN